MDFSRNIGLLTVAQQEALTRASVTVCGVGGMGGIAAEALVRMGVGRLTILDHDHYEASNLNRQVHCTTHVLGRLKVDVVAEKLLAINPRLSLRTFPRLDAGNVGDVVGASDLLINGMDEIRPSILLEREARRRRKTIVDAWLTPYASVFVMKPESPHWEEFLGFPTVGKDVDQITEAELRECLYREIAFTMAQFRTYEIVSRELVEDIIEKRAVRPSLVPVVWLSGTLMANEAMKVLTGQGRLASHWGVFYNQYDHEIRFYSEEGDDARGVASHRIAV